jgi:hypothetical protein
LFSVSLSSNATLIEKEEEQIAAKKKNRITPSSEATTLEKLCLCSDSPLFTKGREQGTHFSLSFGNCLSSIFFALIARITQQSYHR